MTRRLLALTALLLLAPATAHAADVDAGSLRATQEGASVVFSQPGEPGAILRLTGTSPGGTTGTLERVGEGLVRLRLQAPAAATATTASFARPSGERFLGFGERSDEVVRTGGDVVSRVTEGPYQDIEEPFLVPFVPAAGANDRVDATYFPIPWLLSTRGFGVLVEDDPTATHRLGSPWSVSVEGPVLTLLVVAGPSARDVVRRFSAHVGRQPAVLPEALGPWWQIRNGGALTDEQVLARLRGAGGLGSIVQTSTHYLPCADHLAAREQEQRRVAAFEAAQLTNVTYFNPMVCTTHPRYGEAAAKGLLTKNALGQPYEYRYTGASVFYVGQLDPRAPGTAEFWRQLTQEAIDDGHKGWMEDFGEYTPDDARAHDGATGSGAHNAYARDYHALAQAASGDRRLLRYVRSGFTGSAKSSPIVWGGDPTIDWAFDGLESSIRNGLTMGLSGVSRWGSDIGGFFALSRRQTPPELFNRWIQAGFAQGIMRTQGNGFSLNSAMAGRRSEITDPEVLPTWARYAQLRTRVLPYLQRAERQYDATGLPVMRHHALTYGGDPKAVARETEYLLGDDLLVAPVVRPGRTERELYLPEGRWVDLWRSADGELRTLRRPRVLDGGREVTLPAPADELPLLARWGGRIELLPQGGPSWREAVAAGAGRRDVLAFGGTHVRLSGERRRRYDVQWALDARPRGLRVNGKAVRFAWADGVARATVRTRKGTLRLVRRPRR